MNKSNILTILGVIIIIVAAYFIYKAPKPTDQNQSGIYTSDVYTFSTDKDAVTIQYNDDSSKAELNLNGTTYDLERAISGSGAKYETDDGSVVFWEHQGAASVTIDNETVVDGAVLQTAPTSTEPAASDTTMTSPLLSNPWKWEQTKIFR
jgi:membrane-bound inhibitor of C-type lysozyme